MRQDGRQEVGGCSVQGLSGQVHRLADWGDAAYWPQGLEANTQAKGSGHKAT